MIAVFVEMLHCLLVVIQLTIDNPSVIKKGKKVERDVTEIILYISDFVVSEKRWVVTNLELLIFNIFKKVKVKEQMSVNSIICVV